MDRILNTSDGYHLHARFEGTGDGKIIFLHGFPFNNSQWFPQLESLGGHFSMLAPDLRGLGRSTGPVEPSAYSMAVYAKDIAEWFSDSGWDHAVVAGLSMGGYVAFEFLRHFPDRVCGLLLMDTHPYADSVQTLAERRRSQRLVESEGPRVIVESVLEKVLGPTTRSARPEIVQQARDMIIQASPHGVTGALRAMSARPDSSQDLSNITVPTLVLVGEEDMITPPEQVRQWTDSIPDSSLHIIPSAGHLISLEAPVSVNRAIITFMESLPG